MFQICFKRLVNKVFFVKGSKCTQRQRTLSTSQASANRPERPRVFWKVLLIIFMLLPTFYYIFCYKRPFSKTVKKAGADFDTETDISVNIKKNKHTLDPIKRLMEVFILKKSTNEQTTMSQLDSQIGSVDPNARPCAMIATGKSEMKVNLQTEVNQSIENLYPMLGMGGYYNPPDCKSRHKVAILVPYRNRKENLKVFLYNIHPFLMRQKVEYRIFVFEQSGNGLFNRGRLFNAGFLEIERNGEWQCVIFHDVDLLPTDDRIRYTCPILPGHMCASVVENEKIPTYRSLFGGVTAMTMWQYRKVNGYSNMFWGWGGEDNDMYLRIKAAGLGVTRYKKTVARYMALKHQRVWRKHKVRYDLMQTKQGAYKTDGLSTLHYRMLSYASRPLYTHVVIDVNPHTLPVYITEATAVAQFY